MKPLDERGLPINYPFKPDWEVTPRDVQASLESGDIVLIDCRRPDEYERARIEGCHLVPMEELPTRMEDLEDFRDQSIVIYCHHGIRSLRVAAVLRHSGFDEVYSMAGGIDLWSQAVDVNVPTY